uniref:Uncharacterized protein n=1 Tax=Rhizophora mucronata TaxID=61149 RepID=A0A2P2NSF2_RHIMU
MFVHFLMLACNIFGLQDVRKPFT